MHALKIKNWLAIAVVVACMIPFAGAQRVGKVTNLIPSVTGNNKPLKQNDVVTQNEEVVTDATGRLKITLDDGSKLTLGGKSRMKLTKHDSASRQTQIDLIGGRLRSEVSALSRPGQKYEVRTAVAVAGVIGTDFEVVVNPDGSITVYCFSGQVVVTNLAGASVTLGPGQSVTVSPTQMGTPQNFDVGGYSDETLNPFPLPPAPTGGDGLSGGQIAGITIGVIGGAVTGILTTAGGSPNGSFPSPTPDCVVLTSGITTRRAAFCKPNAGGAILTVAKPAANLHTIQHPSVPAFVANALAAHSSSNLFLKPGFPGLQSHAFTASSYTGRNWFTVQAPGGFNSHITGIWAQPIFMNKPFIGGAVKFAVHSWQPVTKNSHAVNAHTGVLPQTIKRH